jgi:hypothetical protein
VLKFENGDKAARALNNLRGEKIGNKMLQVDFNKRLNFVHALNRRSQSSSPNSGGRTRQVAAVTAITAATALANRPRSDAMNIQRAVRNESINSCEDNEDDQYEGAAASARSAPVVHRPWEQQQQQQQQRKVLPPSRTFQPLHIVRDLNSKTRRVRTVDVGGGGGGNDDEDSGSSTTASSEGETGGGKQRQRRPRERKRRASAGRKDIESRMQMLNMAEENRIDPANIVTVPASVTVVIRNIVTAATQVMISSTLKGVLSDRKLPYNGFYLTKLRRPPNQKSTEDKFELRIEVNDVLAAQKIVDAMDSLPYGCKKLKPEFANPKEGLEARVYLVLRDFRMGKATWSQFLTRYSSKFAGAGDLNSITISGLRKMSRVAIGESGNGGETTLALVPEVSFGQPPPANSATSFLHPCVVTTLDNLRERVSRALKMFSPYGIPYCKMLAALNATADSKADHILVLPSDNCGVPLEQLLEALNMVRLERDAYGEYKFFEKPPAAVRDGIHQYFYNFSIFFLSFF